MDLAIPHNLERDEVRRRFRENSHTIADNIPGGLAEVTTTWPSDDRMIMAISAFGQHLNGHVDIEETQVRFHMDLPGALALLEPLIASAIRKQGQDLLEGPKG